MIDIKKEEMHGVVVVTVRLKVPDKITEEVIKDMKRKWNNIYDEHERFVFAVDLTHESINIFSAPAFLPPVMKIIKKNRPRTVKQVVISGLVLNGMSRAVYDLAIRSGLYEPAASEEIRAESMEKLKGKIDKSLSKRARRANTV